MSQIDYNLILSIYNSEAYLLILRHFRDSNPRSNYVCHDCRAEVLYKLVNGASEYVLYHDLNGLIPMHLLLRDKGLTPSNSYGLYKDEARLPLPDAHEYMIAIGNPERWHNVLMKGWASFLVQYIMSTKPDLPRYRSMRDFGKVHSDELGSLTTKLQFLCSGTYTALDLYRGRRFEDYAQQTIAMLAALRCPKNKCAALNWQELVGRKNQKDFPAAKVKSLDGEDAVAWGKMVMFTIRSLMDPQFREVIDNYPGVMPHLEKGFDPRKVMPEASERYAWRPQTLAQVLIKSAAQKFEAAKENGYFDALIQEGRELFKMAKGLKAEEEEREYHDY